MAKAKKKAKKPAKKAKKSPARKSKKTAKKAPARKAAKKAKKKSGAKRKPNAAFMKPMSPDAALGAVIGSSPMPRTEVTKKLWAYIKRNGLQDSKNKRMINADDKLQDVFGGKRQVSMFEMTKLVSRHLR
jgi:chromatin remodeling complex protein RSC6